MCKIVLVTCVRVTNKTCLYRPGLLNQPSYKLLFHQPSELFLKTYLFRAHPEKQEFSENIMYKTAKPGKGFLILRLNQI